MTQLSEAVVLITGIAGGFGQQFTRQLLMAEDRECVSLQNIIP